MLLLLLLLLLKLERRRRQLPSPQLPGSYLAAAAAIINVTWRLSIVNLGMALEFEWVDQGMMQVGLFFLGAVLGVVIRYLLWGHAERDGSHVYHFVALHAWEAEMET